jgi:hypothetical protein
MDERSISPVRTESSASDINFTAVGAIRIALGGKELNEV